MVDHYEFQQTRCTTKYMRSGKRVVKIVKFVVYTPGQTLIAPKTIEILAWCESRLIINVKKDFMILFITQYLF